MSDSISLSDNDLLNAIQNGDDAGFKILYDRYWQLLYVSAFKVLKDEEEAKDVVQDVFISLFNKGATLNIQGSLSNYLYTAVRYKVLDVISRLKVRVDYAESISKFITDEVYTTDLALLNKEIALEIEKEIQNLPGKMREVFLMSRNLNLTHKEIALRLEISDKTVKKQINNAIKLLKPKFINHYIHVGLAFLAVATKTF